ncbi:MAG: tetratricopeptide repeat protein, partial [Candidatus Aminicenantes bacterium]
MRLKKSGGRILALVMTSFVCVGAQNIGGSSSQDLSSQELIQRALNAFRNQNLSESKRLCESLWKKKDASLEDFTRAGRMLAYFEHHFHDNMDGVYPYYDEIIKRNPEKADLYLRLADFELRSHRFKQAQETLKRALKEDLSIEQQEQVGILWSKVMLDKLIWESAHHLDLQQLKEELSKIEGYLSQSPENTELAYLQMGFSLLLKNKPMFWEGWYNYFRLPKDKEARSFLSESLHYLTSGFAAWETSGVSLDLI